MTTPSVRGGGPTIGTNTGSTATVSATLTGTKQPVAGDTLLILHCNDFYDTTTMPTPTVGGSTAGVTPVRTVDGGTNNAHIKAYTYQVASTGDLVVSVTETGSHDEEKILVVHTLQDADTVTPVEDSAGSFSATGDNVFVVNGVNPASSDALMIIHHNSGGGSSGSSPMTPPGGAYTELYDTAVGGLAYTGGTEVLTTSGPTGTRTFTSIGAVSWAAISLAIKGAGAPAATPVGNSPATWWPGQGPWGADKFVADPTSSYRDPTVGPYELGSTPYATANATTVTSASFTPDANALLVAYCAMGNGAGGASSLGTVTDSLGGSWSRVAGNASANGGVGEIWVKDAGASPAAQTATYDPGGAGASGLSIMVKWYGGAKIAAQQPGATATPTGGAFYNTPITPTALGSLIVGALGRATDSQTLTPNANTTILGQVNGTSGDTSALFRANALIEELAAKTFGGSNPGAGTNWIALAEILAAGGTTQVSQSLDVRWISYAQVSQSTDLQWKVSVQVSQSVDVRWLSYTSVSQSSDLRWISYAQVTQNTDLRWKSYAQVTQSTDLRWLSYTSVNQDSDLRWRVSVVVSQSLDLRWVSAAQVTQSLDLRWASYVTISQSTDLRWASYVTVTQSTDLRWRVSVLVSNSLDAPWRVFNAISQNTDMRWAVLNTITQDSDLRWRVMGLASQNVDLRWVVDSTLINVTRDVDLRWAVYGTVTQNTDLRWRTSQIVSNSLDAPWLVYNGVAQSVDLRWLVYELTQGSLDLRWAVLAALSADCDLRWLVRALVANSVDLRWVSEASPLPTTPFPADVAATLESYVAASLESHVEAIISTTAHVRASLRLERRN